jgi:hypothetical protein
MAYHVMIAAALGLASRILVVTASTAILWAADARAMDDNPGCDKAAFETVVATASATLTQINDQNKRAFLEKLQLLKAREGWVEADYVAKATPFVKDERIAAFDAKNQALLDQVSRLGGEEPPDEERRCAMLRQLKAIMTEVVVITGEKWTYMLGKVDAALSVAVTAKTAP